MCASPRQSAPLSCQCAVREACILRILSLKRQTVRWQLCSAPLAPLGSLGSARLRSAPLGSLGSLGSTRLHSAPLGSARPHSWRPAAGPHWSGSARVGRSAKEARSYFATTLLFCLLVPCARQPFAFWASLAVENDGWCPAETVEAPTRNRHTTHWLASTPGRRVCAQFGTLRPTF